MPLKCGIIGLPNVGKSTLFNALTALSANASNYPFCTIEPNTGKVNIPDLRLDQISKYIKTKRIVPATIEFVDIAGIVKGAHKGEGLGNQFLASILDTDAIVHVIRVFSDSDVVHVEGNVNPIRDIEIIDTEIILKDIEFINRQLAKDKKNAKSGDSHAKKDISALERILAILNGGIPLRSAKLDEDEITALRETRLLSVKPVIYVLNISECDINNLSECISNIIDYALLKEIPVICVSAKIEEELVKLNPDERQEFMDGLSVKELGLPSLIKQAYKALRLINFFTANENELRAWNVPEGTPAPKAAGKIHSDFERGFISAEVIHFDDYIKYGGEHACKEHGAVRLEGKEYIVKEGDIIYFRFNV